MIFKMHFTGQNNLTSLLKDCLQIGYFNRKMHCLEKENIIHILSHHDICSSFLQSIQSFHASHILYSLKLRQDGNLFLGYLYQPPLDYIACLINAGADVNAVNDNGYSLLSAACLRNDYHVCELLIEANANINQAGVYGFTPLFYAVIAKNKNITELLLRNGANPNIHGTTGDTPLMIACRNNQADIADMLILHQADTNITDQNGNSLLMNAIMQKSDYFSIKLIEILLKHGISLGITNKNGLNALDVARQQKMAKLATRLTKIAFDDIVGLNEHNNEELKIYSL